MIKSLAIENIQSHKKTKIKFHKGVNVIVGGSDQGKSAILNSIYWCMFNRPLGDQHGSWWGGTMLSSVTLNDGIIELKREKGKNSYKINDNKPLKAFGQEPPQEVKDIFNIDEKINIQRQLEKGVPIFLLSESPGDVAKFFNRVAGLDKIDKAISEGQKDLRVEYRKQDEIKELIKEKEEELEEYEGIGEINEKIEIAVKKEVDIKGLTLEISHIDEELERIGLKEKYLKGLKKKNKIVKKFNRAVDIKEEVDSLYKKIYDIEAMEEQAVVLELLIEKKKEKYKTLSKVKKALVLLKKTKQKGLLASRIEANFHTIELTNEKIKGLSTKKQKTADKLNKNMPDICPLCGSKT